MKFDENRSTALPGQRTRHRDSWKGECGAQSPDFDWAVCHLVPGHDCLHKSRHPEKSAYTQWADKPLPVPDEETER